MYGIGWGFGYHQGFGKMSENMSHIGNRMDLAYCSHKTLSWSLNLDRRTPTKLGALSDTFCPWSESTRDL